MRFGTEVWKPSNVDRDTDFLSFSSYYGVCRLRWIADIGLNQTAHRTKRGFLLGCDERQLSVWWTMHLPTEVYSAKQRSPYMGWMLLPPPSESAPALAHTYLTFELQLSWTWLACLSLLATEPIPDIRWRRTRSWRDMHPTYLTRRVCKKEMKRNERRNGNMKRLLGQYFWSTEQNAVQIISLMFWTCDRHEK